MRESWLCSAVDSLFRRRHNWISGRGRKAWDEHVRIVAAIRERDAELAEILMRRYVAAARHNFEASLRRKEAEGLITEISSTT